jgi:hypothetical protein
LGQPFQFGEAQFKIIEAKAIAARNKKALLEKGILISLEKNEAIKKFVDMIESSEVNKVFALTTSSKIKFLKNLINENNSFQSQSFVN